MEEVLVSLLFIYPGALIEIFYRAFAKYGYKEEESNDQIKIGEYFLYSAIVFVLSLIIYQCISGRWFKTADEVFSEFNNLLSALGYLLLSLVVTGLVAYARYDLSGMNPSDDGGLLGESINGCKAAGSVNAWREIIYGSDFKDVLAPCIVRIRMGDIIETGFVHYFPDDFEKGIILVQSAYVKQQFEIEENCSPDHIIIGDPYVVYVDPASNVIVEFYPGQKLMNSMRQAS